MLEVHGKEEKESRDGFFFWLQESRDGWHRMKVEY